MPELISQYKGLRREVYILFIGRIVTRFGSMIYSMLTLILSQKLGFSASAISVTMLVFSCITMLTSFLGGKLADRTNKKNIIVYCDCISIILYIVCSMLPLTKLTIALIMAAASAQFMEHPAYNALIADITPSKDRQRAYALQYLGTNIGLMAAPTLAGFLFKSYLSLLFIICGAAIAVSTVLIFFFVKDITPVEDTEAVQQRKDGESVWSVIKNNKPLLLYFAIVGLYAAAYDQYTYLMPLDLGRMYGENGAVLYGTVNSTNCIIVVIFSSIILRYFGRIAPEKKTLVGELFLLTGFAVFLVFINYVPAYYIAIILFTFGEIFEFLGDAPFMVANSPASHRGRINGIAEVVRSITDGGLLLVIGKLYDVSGYKVAWGFVIFILLIAIVLTIILIEEEKKQARSGYKA